MKKEGYNIFLGTKGLDPNKNPFDKEDVPENRTPGLYEFLKQFEHIKFKEEDVKKITEMIDEYLKDLLENFPIRPYFMTVGEYNKITEKAWLKSSKPIREIEFDVPRLKLDPKMELKDDLPSITHEKKGPGVWEFPEITEVSKEVLDNITKPSSVKDLIDVLKEGVLEQNKKK